MTYRYFKFTLVCLGCVHGGLCHTPSSTHPLPSQSQPCEGPRPQVGIELIAGSGHLPGEIEGDLREDALPHQSDYVRLKVGHLNLEGQ